MYAFGALVLAALAPLPAAAASAARLDGGTLYFYADSLQIAARNGATFRLAGATVVSGDAAFVDLRSDRAVIAGDARIRRGGVELRADAIAFDLSGRDVDVLQIGTGIARADAGLTRIQAAPDDGERFVFPDLADARAYIRARRADIVGRTSVRFRPAAFPTSVGAPPVPMYLYSFATGNGYAASALAPGAFDQPYGLLSSPNALTALHLRYLNGIGPSLGIQQNLIDGSDGYVAGAVDVPVHAAVSDALDGYHPLGETGSVSLGASSSLGVHVASVGFTQAIGTLVGRVNYGITNFGYSSALASLRTRDRALLGGITWHASASFGFQAQDGGLLPLSPDAAHESTLWQHGLDVFLASPLIRGPLRTTLFATLDGARTQYSYPRHDDALEANLTGSRRLDRALTLFFGYDARWSGDIFPNQYVAGPYASVRVSYRRADDFPQSNFFVGRPPNEVRADLRLRPAPNVGISFGRSYDFGWNGSRWVPGWSLSVFQ